MTEAAELDARAGLIRRVGALLRGDWSMTCCDGRDVQRWLDTALDGDAAALKALDSELTELEGL